MNASTSACEGKMTWSDARALGIPIWLTSLEQFVRLFLNVYFCHYSDCYAEIASREYRTQ